MARLPDKMQLLKDVRDRRKKWGPRPTDIIPEIAGPGEESVWSYPRPPVVLAAADRASVEVGGQVIAASDRALRIVETAGAPVYFFPPEDVVERYFCRTDEISICEWKGAAVHFDIMVGDRHASQAAFTYPDPLDDLQRGYSRIAGWYGFYPARVDRACVGNEQARAQNGDVYAGWITDAIKGPVKGAPGTAHW